MILIMNYVYIIVKDTYIIRKRANVIYLIF